MPRSTNTIASTSVCQRRVGWSRDYSGRGTAFRMGKRDAEGDRGRLVPARIYTAARRRTGNGTISKRPMVGAGDNVGTMVPEGAGGQQCLPAH